MNKIIPIFYSEYGRYINRFRAIPSFIDGLKPVERRVLISLYKEGRKKAVKSATVVGYALGHLHPHGDQSLYGTLVNMVHQEYAKGEGNWGSPGLEDADPAAYRYTETSLEKWVDDLAFTYLDEKYVPYQEFELEPEPLYLPSPIPIGLIGNGVITGISFYRTLIPKYKLSDLAKRLFWILSGKNTKTEIIICPVCKDCTIQEVENGEFKNILVNGIGSLNYIPNGKIDQKNIHILGRAPNSSFNSLIEDQEKLDIVLIENSGETIDVLIEPKKRSMQLQEIGKNIWQNYLIKKLNFNCLFCDNEGIVTTYGIDQILEYNYNLWKYSVQLKNIDEYNKLSAKKIEFMIVQIIRYIIETHKPNSTNELVEKFKELKKNSDINLEIDIFNIETLTWKKEIKNIIENDIITVCGKRTIKNLVETIIDIKKIDSELVAAKSLIDNCDVNCFNYIDELSKI